MRTLIIILAATMTVALATSVQSAEDDSSKEASDRVRELSEEQYEQLKKKRTQRAQLGYCINEVLSIYQRAKARRIGLQDGMARDIIKAEDLDNTSRRLLQENGARKTAVREGIDYLRGCLQEAGWTAPGTKGNETE